MLPRHPRADLDHNVRVLWRVLELLPAQLLQLSGPLLLRQQPPPAQLLQLSGPLLLRLLPPPQSPRTQPAADAPRPLAQNAKPPAASGMRPLARPAGSANLSVGGVCTARAVLVLVHKLAWMPANAQGAVAPIHCAASVSLLNENSFVPCAAF